MYFGEDRNKISRIVQPNVEKFRCLYEPYLNELVHLSEGIIIKKVILNIFNIEYF